MVMREDDPADGKLGLLLERRRDLSRLRRRDQRVDEEDPVVAEDGRGVRAEALRERLAAAGEDEDPLADPGSMHRARIVGKFQLQRDCVTVAAGGATTVGAVGSAIAQTAASITALEA